MLDEAYCDLLGQPQWNPALLAGTVVLRSLTKAWGLAGLRLGYAILGVEEAAALRAAARPGTSTPAPRRAGSPRLPTRHTSADPLSSCVKKRDRLVGELRDHGWQVEPSAAGFFLVHVSEASEARRALLAGGCVVRGCSSFGLPEHVRVSPRLAAQNRRLLTAFAALAPPMVRA